MRVQLVVEAASWFPARAGELAIALGQEPGSVAQFPDWLASLVLDLGRAGLGAEAALVSQALAQVDPDRRAYFDGDTAIALADAGLADEARVQIEANLTRWPDDFWTRVNAGDALATLGDLDGAEAHFHAALSLAEQADDFKARYQAVDRLTRMGPGLSHDGRREIRTQRRQPKRSRSQRKRKR